VVSTCLLHLSANTVLRCARCSLTLHSRLLLKPESCLQHLLMLELPLIHLCHLGTILSILGHHVVHSECHGNPHDNGYRKSLHLKILREID